MSSEQTLEQPYLRPLSGKLVEIPPSARIPARCPIQRQYVELVPQNAAKHACDLFDAGHDSEQALKTWDYLAYGLWASVADYSNTMRAQSANFETILNAIRPLDSEAFEGQSSYLDISPLMSVIEIGHIWFGTRLMWTRAAT